MFDVTTDLNEFFVLNILVGECDEISRNYPTLMRTVELTQTNPVNINREIIILLFSTLKLHENYEIRLFLSDGAQYGVKYWRNCLAIQICYIVYGKPKSKVIES
jgi:hypothetical protein